MAPNYRVFSGMLDIGFESTRTEALELARQYLLDNPGSRLVSIMPMDGKNGWTLVREVAESQDVDWMQDFK